MTWTPTLLVLFDDLKTYVNENILSVSKKFDQKYCDLTEQLLQHEREINKETQKIQEKIDDLSKLGNNSLSSINNNVHKAITHKRDAFTKETVQFTNNTETFGPQAEQQNLLGAFSKHKTYQLYSIVISTFRRIDNPDKV